MSKLREQVTEFHRVFEHPTALAPTELSPERLRLRLKLVLEEAFEMVLACAPATNEVGKRLDEMWRQFEFILKEVPNELNLVGVVDALADLDYVIEGFRLELGVDGGPIADEVHRSNLSKLGADGRPIKRADGKTVKGPNYSPPDIASELRRQGWKGDAR